MFSWKKYCAVVAVLAVVGLANQAQAAGSCCAPPTCGQVTAVPATAAPPAVAKAPGNVQSTRSFSYEPEVRTNSVRSSGSRNSTPTWMLLKTDPRRYGG